ncbi:MAG: hypothetical protein ABW022_10480 [Actinoplanes sp.]
MTTTSTSTPTRTTLAGWAGIAGAVTSAVAGAIQAVRTDDGNPFVDPTEHVLLALIAITLVLWVPAYLALGRHTGSRVGGWLAAFGCALLAFGITSTNLHDQDYSWFSVVAIPANLTWLIGSVLLAVAAWRGRTLPRWAAAVLPLVWVTSIILSQAGGNLIAGAIWAVVGWFLVTAGRRS